MYDVITVRCISMCARVTCIFFLLLCVFNVHSVYVYISVYSIIYCIVRSVPMRGTNTRSDTETRETLRREIFFFFLKKKRYGVRAARVRARSRLSRTIRHTRSSSLTQLFPVHPSTDGTSKCLSTLYVAHSNPRSQTRQRSTAHVYLRYQFFKILKLDFN